ncbi:unnamed protein product [Ectocarpus fasciculatus]
MALYRNNVRWKCTLQSRRDKAAGGVLYAFPWVEVPWRFSCSTFVLGRLVGWLCVTGHRLRRVYTPRRAVLFGQTGAILDPGNMQSREWSLPHTEYACFVPIAGRLAVLFICHSWSLDAFGVCAPGRFGRSFFFYVVVMRATCSFSLSAFKLGTTQ